MNGQSAKTKSPFYETVKSEISIFANMFCILDKMEEDSNLSSISNLLQQIFQREILFTINGKVKRAEETKNKNPQFRFQFSINEKHFDF